MSVRTMYISVLYTSNVISFGLQFNENLLFETVIFSKDWPLNLGSTAIGPPVTGTSSVEAVAGGSAGGTSVDGATTRVLVGNGTAVTTDVTSTGTRTVAIITCGVGGIGVG